MKINFSLLLLVSISMLVQSNLFAQSFTQSNLPIVILTTDNSEYIPDEPKIGATMKIIYRGEGLTNYVSDASNEGYLNYNGRVQIEERGSSSALYHKKSYGFKTVMSNNVTNNNVSILGMPKEHDWILSGIAFDTTYIRDVLSYTLMRKMGNYAARIKFCELVLNGDYVGLYTIIEKIKIDDNRVNISSMSNKDIDYPDVTGGYIVKADKQTGNDPIAWSMEGYAWDCSYIHHDPRPEEVTIEQTDYISQYFFDIEETTSQSNSIVEDGYPSLIDLPSFVDYMVINEHSANVDGYHYSTYFHKDKGGKLRAGPIWDFNLTYGNDLFMWGLDRSHTNSWQFYNGDNTGSKFWKDLFDDIGFGCLFANRWKELTAQGKVLSYASVCSTIDSLTTLISSAKTRDMQRWNLQFSYNSKISEMKLWINNRITWVSQNMSQQLCTTPTPPKLVISKINYNPQAIMDEVSKKWEFIEITNADSKTVSLSGMYFKELGFTYIFPNNSQIQAGEKIYLASNAMFFENKYGVTPFGEFRKNLSNTSEAIVLCDPYGNIIDKVQYTNTTPWPAQANGQGGYLELNSVTADNALAQNWKSSNIPLSVSNISNTKTISLFPSEVRDICTITSSIPIQKVEIISVVGTSIKTLEGARTLELQISLHDIPQGMYVAKVYQANGKISSTQFIKF